MLNILHYRSKSLAVEVYDPPRRWVHMLSHETELVTQAGQNMKSDWKALLRAEAAFAKMPREARAVGALVWNHFVAVRLILMGYEQQGWSGGSGGSSGVGERLLRAALQHPGDSKLIEDIHQYLRDLERNARHEVSSRVERQLAAIESDVLARRHIRSVQLDLMTVANANVQHHKTTSFNAATKPQMAKLPPVYQDIMKPQKNWPSTSPTTVFNRTAATEWVLKVWRKSDAGRPRSPLSANSAWLTVLTQLGDLLCERDTVKGLVVASAEWSCLLWAVNHTDSNHVVLQVTGQPISWYHICDIQQVTVRRYAPVVHEGVIQMRLGLSESLTRAALSRGCHLTVANMRLLLQALGETPAGNTRITLLGHLVAVVFADADENERKMVENRLLLAEGASAEMDLEAQLTPDLEEVLEAMDPNDREQVRDLQLAAKRKAVRVKRKAEDADVEVKRAKSATDSAGALATTAASCGSGGSRGSAEVVDAAPEEPAGQSKRGGGPKQYSSPMEVLRSLVPPTASINCDQNAHRWRAVMPTPAGEAVVGFYAKNSHSKRFHLQENDSWKESLADCHRWLWEKYQLLPELASADVEPQVPGALRPEILDYLQLHFIDTVPLEIKQYHKTK